MPSPTGVSQFVSHYVSEVYSIRSVLRQPDTHSVGVEIGVPRAVAAPIATGVHHPDSEGGGSALTKVGALDTSCLKYTP
jgi:hypothetical protein